MKNLKIGNGCGTQTFRANSLENLHTSTMKGFTLIELIVVVTIIGVLAAIATPAFTETLLSYQLRATANKLVSSALLARGEAIKRNKVITLCASSDGSTCTGSWEQGWVVLNGSDLISAEPAVRAGYKVKQAGTQTSLSFQPTGIGSTQAALTVCRKTPSVGSAERVVSISTTGRPSVAKKNDGVCT